eukprot:6922338-Pyramimonas_sp.AAC.2
MSTSMAFPAHASNHAPCVLCAQTQEEIHDHSIPLRPHPPDYYDMECKSHEIWIVIENAESHREVRFALEWRSKCRGRALRKDIPGLGLLENDRLEATPHMHDVQKFDSVKEFPILVLFWRARENSRVYRRNPLISDEIGTSLSTFSLDELHLMHLGIFKVFVGASIWRLLIADVFNTGARLQDDKIRIGLPLLVQNLQDFY